MYGSKDSVIHKEFKVLSEFLETIISRFEAGSMDKDDFLRHVKKVSAKLDKLVKLSEQISDLVEKEVEKIESIR
jgi:predicted transcriptional regulator